MSVTETEVLFKIISPLGPLLLFSTLLTPVVIIFIFEVINQFHFYAIKSLLIDYITDRSFPKTDNR